MSWGQLAVLRRRVCSAHMAGNLAWLSVTLSLGMKLAEAGQLSALASNPSVGRGDGHVGSCHVPEPVGSLPWEWEDGVPWRRDSPSLCRSQAHPHLRFPKGTWGHMSVGMCAGEAGHADPGGYLKQLEVDVNGSSAAGVPGPRGDCGGWKTPPDLIPLDKAGVPARALVVGVRHHGWPPWAPLDPDRSRSSCGEELGALAPGAGSQGCALRGLWRPRLQGRAGACCWGFRSTRPGHRGSGFPRPPAVPTAESCALPSLWLQPPEGAASRGSSPLGSSCSDLLLLSFRPFCNQLLNLNPLPVNT